MSRKTIPTHGHTKMNYSYNAELLSLKWTKEEEYILHSGKSIRRFKSIEGASAILIGGLEYNESDHLSKPVLVGSLILLLPPTWRDHHISLEYDSYDVITKEDIVCFLIENLERL